MVLRPIAKHAPIATVSNELLRVLRYLGVEVVHYVVDHAFALNRYCRIPMMWVCFYFVARLESVHVDVSVLQ